MEHDRDFGAIVTLTAPNRASRVVRALPASDDDLRDALVEVGFANCVRGRHASDLPEARDDRAAVNGVRGRDDSGLPEARDDRAHVIARSSQRSDEAIPERPIEQAVRDLRQFIASSAPGAETQLGLTSSQEA